MTHRIALTIHRGGDRYEVVDLDEIKDLSNREFTKRYGKTALKHVNKNLRALSLPIIPEDEVPDEV
ncbi:MAG: hypothetical protein NWE76_05370 [Candidatus Bathyarchaeota archaeon]|nr:hypothetical protein [Candidatus Bathyarchaeota archaeon]